MILRFKLFLTILILIPLIDFLWIGLLMKPFYMENLGAHRRLVNGEFSPLLAPAFFVYVLLGIAITFFILSWVSTWTEALGWGALLGLIIYGVYDLTNMATLADYPLKLVLVDMVWGATLCGLVSLITYFEREWLK